jgi:serine/threonine protein kinase
MDEVNEQMSSNPDSMSVMTLTEFYRIVIGYEKLILQCCDPNWQTAAIWVMDCKSTFLMRISELLWCSAIMENTTWQDAAFTERIDEISQRLSDYAEEDRSQLKNILGFSTVVDSRYVSGDLVTYLSQRVDAKGGEVVECALKFSSRERIVIGEGESGNVCKEIMFNESVAIKVFNEGKEEEITYNSKCKNRATSEASVMAKLNHPGIVLMVGVSSYPGYGRCLILELMSGDLSYLIHNRPRFSLHVSVDIFFVKLQRLCNMFMMRDLCIKTSNHGIFCSRLWRTNTCPVQDM